MSLRLQLALVCLSLLLLPWALFLFVGELDKNLREVQLSQSQSDSIAAKKEVGAYLLNSNTRVRPESKTLLAGLINNDILVDAYADDWSAYELHSRRYRYPMNKLSVELEDRELASEFTVHSAVRGNRLFLFVKVQDKDLVYHDPLSRRIASGDQLIIRVPAPDGSIRRYTFRWEAAGSEVGRYYGNTRDGRRPISIANDYRAALNETDSGYHIELSIPLPAEGKFGLSLIDVDTADEVQRWTGMFDPSEEDDVGQLVLVDRKLNELLQAYAEPGMRLRVFDSQGWMVGDADMRMPDSQVEQIRSNDRNFIDSLLYRFISWSLRSNTAYQKLPAMDDGRLKGENYILFTGLVQGPEFLQDKYGRVFHTSVQEITNENDLVAHLLVQKPRAALTAFTRDAILRLIKIFGFVVLLVAAVLIGFASLLSYRVRKLRNAVEQSVTDNGAIIGAVGRSSARDEIGDLSRSFHTMIGRLKAYTHYLQSLGSRLSHELRTPLSVVATSIEGIDKTALTEQDAAALVRAELGTARLQRLIRNLSEASSVEQTIERADKAVIDMVDWVKVARDVYDNLYKNHEVRLQVTGNAEHANVDASVELLHQMLDKLMSNAVDFSSPGGVVSLQLAVGKNKVLLSVENHGPLLAANSEELFEPMVSFRNNQDQQPHMGFGLHIVKLIADYHQGRCFAHNNAAKNGVVFSVEFNRLSLQAT